MVDRNPVKSLERAYNEAGELQIYREIYMNSLEAGATRAQVVNLNNKLAWLDDGCGIEVGDLDQLINGRNSSSKNTDGRHGNFGVGLKDAGLFPNPYGLIVVSKTESKPKGGMIWLCIDPELGAGAKLLISDEMKQAGYTGDGESVIDFEDHDSFTIDNIDFMSVFTSFNSRREERSGTAIIFMGQNKDSSTFPDLVTVRKYLQSRIFKFDLNIIGLVNEARPQFLTGICKGHNRNVISTMSIKGFTVETSLNKGELKKGARDPAERRTFTEATLYKNEMYGVSYTSSRASQATRSRSTALKYGIIYPAVYNRVIVVIKPPIYDEATGRGCFPDSSRSSLKWEDPDSQDRQSGIPYEMIQEYYRNNIPEELQKLMSEIAKSETRKKQKTHTGRLSRFFSKNKKSRLRLRGDGHTLMSSQAGTEDGGDDGPLFDPPKPKENTPETESESASPKAKPKPKNKPKPLDQAEKRKKRARKKAGTVDPGVIFSDEDETGAAAAALLTVSGASYPFCYEEESNRLYVNTESPLISDELVPACLAFLKSKKGSYSLEISAEQAFIYVVKPSLREALPTTISHALTSTYLHNVGIHPRNPQHIAMMVTGLWQLERFYLKWYSKFKTHAQVIDQAG